MSAPTCERDFRRGFICAVAALLNAHGNGTEVADLLRCAGNTDLILKDGDAEDIRTLRAFGYLDAASGAHGVTRPTLEAAP